MRHYLGLESKLMCAIKLLGGLLSVRQLRRPWPWTRKPLTSTLLEMMHFFGKV